MNVEIMRDVLGCRGPNVRLLRRYAPGETSYAPLGKDLTRRPAARAKTPAPVLK
jgi:hypothetical protein